MNKILLIIFKKYDKNKDSKQLKNSANFNCNCKLQLLNAHYFLLSKFKFNTRITILF